MNQKSNQSKEQLHSEVLPEETLFALLQSGDSRGLEEAQKNIDDHIKKQCDAKSADFWDYYLEPRYPEVPDNYNGYDQSVAIMAYNVVNCPQTALEKIYEIRPGEFQTRGMTQYHLVPENYDAVVLAPCKFPAATRPIRCSTLLGFQGRS